MEKSSSIVLTEGEKAMIRGGELPPRFEGYYTLDELKAYL